jgi:diaminopimelate decarboxylase
MVPVVSEPVSAAPPQPNTNAEQWASLAARAAAAFGTPCYVTRWAPVRDAVEAQEACFDGIAVRSWLSFKTHPVPQLARAWLRSGRGVEVASEAELVTLQALGCDSAQLLVNGVAKHTWLEKHAAPGLHVHVDSEAEAAALAPVAARLGWQVGIRCHVPAERDVRDERFGGQFGMSECEARNACRALDQTRVPVQGLHFHLGQAARQPGAYKESFDYLVAVCLRNRLRPYYLDCGGGVDGAPDVGAALAEIGAAFAGAARRVPSLRELWLENGRYLTAASASLAVSVVDRKVRPEGRYLICDGGRTNHALAADNGLHRVLTVPERSGAQVLTTLCGPTCMTDDRLCRVPLADTVRLGDLVVWLDTGAYHLPWETRFSHGYCAVVWVDEAGRLSLARARETVQQWADVWNLSE